jgi:hypothetical protein
MEGTRAGAVTAVVLHIGLHKTGTTSIQETLAAHRDLLAARGILFPASLPANHSQFVYDAFSAAPERYHANLARGLDAAAIAARTAATVEALRREIAAKRPATLVLSAEDACTLSEAEVARLAEVLPGLVERPEPRVLLYTRHPVTYVESAVEENIRGNGLTLERAKAIHIAGTADRYRTIAARWGAVFGERAVELRAFETAAAGPGGLVGDALAAIGTTAEGIGQVRANVSVAGEIVRFLAERNARGAPPLAPADARLLFALRGTRADLLTAADRQRIAERAAADVVWLAERWGIRYDLTTPRRTPDEVERHRRHAAFRAALSAILGELSPPLAAELDARFALSPPPSFRPPPFAGEVGKDRGEDGGG